MCAYLSNFLVNTIKVLSIRFVIIIALLGISLPGGAADIHGNIILLEGWKPVIYLSQLNSFDDLNTASYHLLIAKADIDEEGNFHFDSLNIPKFDLLYRLHICKEEDPISTIIIGGQEQNHLHLLMNNSSLLNVAIRSFHDFDVGGHHGNATLQELFDLKGQINAPLNISSDQNRILHKEHIKNEFIRIVDSARSDVNKLLALHFLQKSFKVDEYEGLYKTLPEQLSDEGDSSPYYEAFIERVQFYNFNHQENGDTSVFSIARYYWLLMPIVFLGFYYWKHLKPKELPIDPSGSLSIQEKKVYELLCTGKSNKEISAELHIEVSTVKSHVYKIFTKLGIKSRRELVS